MHPSGESKKEVLRPDFNRSIMLDFQGAKLSSDTGFLLMRELDQRHNIIAPMADILIEKKDKYRFILDVDSTEDPAYGKQEGCEYNGHFGKNCFHPIVSFTGNGDCLAAELRPGNVHSADDVLDFIKPLTGRYGKLFKLFWFRGDAAFAQPGVYDYCEAEHITYFIRLPINDILKKIMEPEIRTRPVGRPPKSGVKVQLFEFPYRAGTWKKRRRVVCKIEWHNDELFPRLGFIVTNSTLPAWKVVRAYNGRANVENRIKEAKNTLRWDKTSCHRFEANQARLKMGAVAYNLLHMIREFHLQGEDVKRSIDWIIRRIIKVASGVSRSGRRWWGHVASSFPLAHHYRAVLGTG